MKSRKQRENETSLGRGLEFTQKNTMPKTKRQESHKRTEGRHMGAEGNQGKSKDKDVVNSSYSYYKSNSANCSDRNRQW